MKKTGKTELKLQDIKIIETNKTLGNYSEKEKEKYEFDKTRNFYNSILDMFHKFRIKKQFIIRNFKLLINIGSRENSAMSLA